MKTQTYQEALQTLVQWLLQFGNLGYVVSVTVSCFFNEGIKFRSCEKLAPINGFKVYTHRSDTTPIVSSLFW